MVIKGRGGARELVKGIIYISISQHKSGIAQIDTEDNDITVIGKRDVYRDKSAKSPSFSLV